MKKSIWNILTYLLLLLLFLHNNNSIYLEENSILSNEEIAIINFDCSANFVVIKPIVKKYFEYKENRSNKNF